MSSIKKLRLPYDGHENLKEQNDMFEYSPEIIDRPTSAPPNLEEYENMIRNDIDIQIFHPMYQKFYESRDDKQSLPPPMYRINEHYMYNNIYENNGYSLFGNDGENHMTEEQSGTNETQYNNFIRFGAKTNPTTPRNVQNNESGMYEDGNFTNGHDVFFAAPGGPVSSQSNHERLPEYWNHNMRRKSSKDLPRNKNVGKVMINSDSNLNSSTEDLLSLAGKTHLKNSLADLKLSRSSSRSDIPQLQLSKVQSSIDSDNSNSNKQTCRYFSQGYCSKGSKCSFLHSGEKSESNSTETYNSNTNPQTTPRKTPRNVPVSPNKYSQMAIEDCVSNINEICKDQHGCRFLQKKLDEDKTSKTCTIIYKEVLSNFSDLMSDPFGNYLCQKLIEKCSVEQRIELVKSVSKSLVKISKNMHGTRAVQKTIEQVSSPEEIKVIRESLKGNVVSLIQDLNGNHVIQKCIHKLEPNDNQFIYDAVAQHCVQVATHKHGCCVMQRCIDHSSNQQQMQLIEEIKNNALGLVQDAFGNYVVQYVLDLGYQNICHQIAEKLQKNMFYLATQKFSSNVVEKCFKVGNEATVKMMSKHLAEHNLSDSTNPSQDPLIELLQHPFGNYVVQTSLQVSSTKAPEEWQKLADRIKVHIHNLKSTPYVKRIQTLILSQEKSNESVESNQ